MKWTRRVLLFIVGMGVLVFAIDYRNTPQEVPCWNSCEENLAKIAGAKFQWADEEKKINGTKIDFATLAPADGTGWLTSEPECPFGGTYTINVIGVKPTCSIPEHNEPPRKWFSMPTWH